MILNAGIFPDMKLTNMEKKWITCACLNDTCEGKEKRGIIGISNYLIINYNNFKL